MSFDVALPVIIAVVSLLFGISIGRGQRVTKGQVLAQLSVEDLFAEIVGRLTKQKLESMTATEVQVALNAALDTFNSPTPSK